MTAANEAIIKGIQDNLKLNINEAKEWYVGLASNIRKKLFEEHKISEENGRWIYQTLANKEIAKEIKQHFVSLGLKSEDSNDDQSGNIIFIYKIAT